MALFIVFEGIDGAGKTTLIKSLIKDLNSSIEDLDIVSTREPNNRVIRESLKDASIQLEPKDILNLFLEDRAEHVKEIVLDLWREKIVICDRYILSNIAYQGYGDGLDIGGIKERNNKIVYSTTPDITFLIDIPVSVSKDRTTPNNNDRFDTASIEYLNRVRLGYLAEAKKDDSIFVLNGTNSISELTNKIIKVLNKNYL